MRLSGLQSHLPATLLRAAREAGRPRVRAETRRRLHLSEMSCNHDIKIFWMGHRPESMSEPYSKLKEKVEVRQKEAERAGVSFDLQKRQIVKQAS
jgi:hypothetical protein